MKILSVYFTVSVFLLGAIAWHDTKFLSTMAWGIGAMSFVFAKLALAELMCVGHGVGAVRTFLNTTHILGIPWMLWIIMMLMSALATGMIFFGFYGFGHGVNFVALDSSLGIFLGIGAAICFWHIYASDATWYFSTYSVIMELKQKGWNEEQIKKEVAKLRRQGFLAPAQKNNE